MKMPRVCPLYWPDAPNPLPRIGEYHEPPQELKWTIPTPPTPPHQKQRGQASREARKNHQEGGPTRPRSISPPGEGGRAPGHLACADRLSKGLAGNVVVHGVPFPCRNQGCYSYTGPAMVGPSIMAESQIQHLVALAPWTGGSEDVSEVERSLYRPASDSEAPSTHQTSAIEFFPSTTTHSASASPIIPDAMLASTCSAPATYLPETHKRDFSTPSRSSTIAWTDNAPWPSPSTSYTSEAAQTPQERKVRNGWINMSEMDGKSGQQVSWKGEQQIRIARRRNRGRGRGRGRTTEKLTEISDEPSLPATPHRTLHPEAQPFHMPTAVVAATPTLPPPTPPTSSSTSSPSYTIINCPDLPLTNDQGFLIGYNAGMRIDRVLDHWELWEERRKYEEINGYMDRKFAGIVHYPPGHLGWNDGGRIDVEYMRHGS